MLQLTIYFDSPFYVGVLEEVRNGQLYAARHVFGAEPNNQQVYEFVLTELESLRAQMTVGVPVESTPRERINPKRMQREIRRELERQGVRRKAHDAMRAQYEQQKSERQKTRKRRRKGR